MKARGDSPAGTPAGVLTAYEVADTTGWEIVPAPYQRQWMEETPGRGAYRCLPLSMANQAGWLIRAPFSFSANWNGAVDPAGVTLDFDTEPERAARSVLSHFGTGILTFQLPFLFRTPPGIGLLVRGAPNWPVVNFAALEGLVETDWNPASFTMNWKILEPDRPVVFRREWPVCFLQPFDLNLPESLGTARRPLGEEPAEQEHYTEWRSSRAAFMESEERKKGGWQRDYFQGIDAKGNVVPTHRTSFRLSAFGTVPPPHHRDPDDEGQPAGAAGEGA